jgi:hypothetical protein
MSFNSIFLSAFLISFGLTGLGLAIPVVVTALLALAAGILLLVGK